jgi:hypothetical protein
MALIRLAFQVTSAVFGSNTSSAVVRFNVGKVVTSLEVKEAF